MITLPQTLGFRAARSIPWTPSTLGASLWAWYDATQQGGTDGVAVSQVTDYSGNGRHLTSSTSFPLYRSTSFSGSRPCFDCTSQRRAQATVTFTGSAMSFFVAFQYRNAPNGNGRVFSLKGPSSDWGEAGGAIAAYLGGTSAVAMRVGVTETFATGLASGTSFLLSAVMQSGTFTIHKDGTQSAGSPKATGAGNFNASEVWFGGSTGEQCNGYIAEAFAVSSAASSDDRQKAEGYLAHKYALTGLLPVSHPYKTTAP